MIEQLLNEEHVVAGVTLKASVGQQHLKHALELTCVLANQSDETVYWGHINGYKDCEIRVFDMEKNAAPLSSIGKQVMGGPIGEYRKYRVKALAPGESQTWRIDLAKVYDLNPGDYVVECRTLLNIRTGPFIVRAEPVRFQVLPMNDREAENLQ